MAHNEIEVDAPREQVFAVLANPAQYAEWVVGADAVHAADASWPAAGARLRHRTGMGPAAITDETEVVESHPPERLVLLAHLGPLGSFRVDMRLEELAERSTRVVMEEEPVEGVSRLAGPVGDAAGKVRNSLSLRRLKELAER
jgi:uncharacterized protein YndB with AHSA1/START domain